MPSFQAPVSYAGGDYFGSLAVAAADFNRDGTPDLVMPDSTNGAVDVLLGNRDGTFQPARAAAVLGTPSAVAVGDFNGDGKPDIVTTDDYNGLANVLLGNGDGTFNLAQYFRLPATATPENQTLYSVAVGDLNGDGKPDLVITGGATGNYVNVLLGCGDGTFSLSSTVQVPTAYDGTPVALGDFNGDGRLDVATPAANGVLILPGNGDGTLGTARTFDTNGSPGSVVVGDFNGDGKLDLAVTDGTVNGGPTASVLLGNGDGTFQPVRSSAIGTGGQWLAVADFNHDGRADLVTANTDGGNVTVLLGKGDGTFQNALSYAAGPNPWAIAAADFNGDGLPDLAVANNNTPGTVSVLLNAADWSAPQASSLSVSGFPSPAIAGTAGNFTVTAKYADGSVDTNYTGTVLFTTSDPQAALPAAYTFTAADAGVHTFSATLKTAGTQSITATDYTSASVRGTDAGITVTPAAASTLGAAGFPSPTTAGVAGSFTVTARDPYGNVATGYTGTVRFTSSDTKASLPANYTFTAADAGTHTFSATLKTAGTQSITATDAANGSLTATDAAVAVSPAAASQFIISAPASVSAGASFSLTVTVEDAYGNIVTNYTGTVHFGSTDTRGRLPSNYAFTAADRGVHTFTGLVLRTRGNQKVTITDTRNGALTASVVINVL